MIIWKQHCFVGGGAYILLPFRKEQICFHKNEQKIRPLGVGLNIFCEGWELSDW